MSIISVENISKNYTEKILMDNLTLSIDENDKIGLIGVNGTGKSTLLKIIAGIEEPDSGSVIKRKEVEVHYLPQNPEYKSETTVLEQVFEGDTPILKLIKDYEDIIERAKFNYSEELQDKLTKLSSQMDSLNAWHIESEAKKILSKLGITDFEVKIGEISGGQRKRVFLAQALIRPCELLILDEPTNHLDSDTILWLEEYLKSRKGALLMITHDRYFLDRVVSDIVELEKGQVYRYKGNYSLYLEKKAERELNAINAEAKRKSLYKKELEWIRTGAKARTTKQKARIQRFEDIKDGKIDTDFNQNIDMTVVGSRRLGKKIIDINNIDFSFENKDIIKGFEYSLTKGDRIGIVGENGSGKSTLLNLLTGLYEPQKGSIEIGDTVKVGYYSQWSEGMDESMRVIDYIKDEAEFIATSDGKSISASQMLERFLFPPEVQYTLIGKLSGGERRRLFLLRILMGNPNVLLLDEPTNDLDIYTLTILEEYIEAFEGVVICVSHDRYFLDKICDKIFAFEGNGKVIQYTGNYFDYCDSKNAEETSKKEVKKESQGKEIVKKEKLKTKFTFKEQTEYDTLPGKMEALENEIDDVNKKLNKAASNYVLLQELTEKQDELEAQLYEMMERWEELQELVKEIENNKS